MNASEAGAGRDFYLAGGWAGNYGSGTASLGESLHPQTPAAGHWHWIREKQGTESDRGTGAH